MDSPNGDIPAHLSNELIEIIQKLSLVERGNRFGALMDFTRGTQKCGIKMRNPSFTREEVNAEFKRQMHAFYARQLAASTECIEALTMSTMRK